MENTATSRPVSALVVLLCAGLIVGVGFAERADSKRFSQKEIKSVSKKRLAGTYSGPTEEGSTVSFRLTRAGKIVDLTVPINLGCTTLVGDLDNNGAINGPGETSESTKSIAFTSAPLSGRKKTAHYPFGMTFEYATPFLPADQPPLGTEVMEYTVKVVFTEGLGGNIFRPTSKKAAVMNGQVIVGTTNGPLTPRQPGLTNCSMSINGKTSSHPINLDFDAKKSGN